MKDRIGSVKPSQLGGQRNQCVNSACCARNHRCIPLLPLRRQEVEPREVRNDPLTGRLLSRLALRRSRTCLPGLTRLALLPRLTRHDTEQQRGTKRYQGSVFHVRDPVLPASATVYSWILSVNPRTSDSPRGRTSKCCLIISQVLGLNTIGTWKSLVSASR